MQYIAIALAPGIAICLFIFYKDVYNREPRFNLLISFLLGCMAILPAIIFEQAFEYAVVAFSEEFSKFLGLRLYSYSRKSFDEPLDGIVYSVMVGMGFATLENLMYVLKFAEMGRGMEVGISRMFLSVPAHGTFAVIMGYFIGKAKFNPGRRFLLMTAGILGAIFFHGTFDFFLFINKYSFAGKDLSEVLLAGGAIASFIVSLVLSRKLIRQHQQLSRQMFNPENKITNA